ncbi:DUF4817 domain-containing protein [Trichonephila clavipes]|nr:DUF4817 domain-containing protein [Trichonephila clavipes]
MECFTNTELADLYLIFGLAEGSTRAAEILHRENYPHRDAPDRRMFANLHHNLCEYGSLRDNRQCRRATSDSNHHGTRIPQNDIQHILFHAWYKLCWIPWPV